MKNKKEKEEHINFVNIQIFDSILDDDENTFFQLVMQNNNDKNYNKQFLLTKYKLPSILSNKPTYSSLCAAFGAEKCFDSILSLFPEGINSSLINEPDEQGRKPIHFACFSGNLHIIRLYYQVGYDFNLKDHQGRTPSHYAAMSYSTDSIKYLFSKGIKIPAQLDNKYLTPMHIACLYGNIEIVKFLCEKVAKGFSKFMNIKGARYNYNYENETPLHLACQSGCTEIVDYILSKKKSASKMIDEIDFKKRKPIHCAIQSGSFECVKSLINFGLANISCKGRRHMVLIDASAGGYADIVSYLLKQKIIDVNAINSKNITALDAAILNNHLDVVKLLIKNGAAHDYDDQKIGNLFLEACGIKNIEMIKYLDSKFNIPYDEKGDKFMNQAVAIEWEELVCFLLDKNCKIFHNNFCICFKNKWTPFMTFLKEKGGDFLNVSDDGITRPLIIKAIESGNLDTVKQMIEKGSELTKEMISKFDCLFYPCSKVKLDLLNFLLSYQPEPKDLTHCIIILIDKYIELKNKNKQNKKKMNDCIIIARTLANQYEIDLNNYVIVSNIIYSCSIEFLEFLVDYSVDFNDCPLNYSQMVSSEYLPVFIFLENHGCNFMKTTTNSRNYRWCNYNEYTYNQDDSSKYPPIALNIGMSRYFNYDVNTLLFLIKYAKNDDIIKVKHYNENLIDILISFNCYDGILKVYMKLNGIIYPELSSKDDFLRVIYNSSNNELIQFINNYYQ